MDNNAEETKRYRVNEGKRKTSSVKLRENIIKQCAAKKINISEACEKHLIEILGKKDAETACEIILATLKNTVELTDPADAMKNREHNEKTVQKLLSIMRGIILMIERDVYKK
jgi:hypothetical protein